MSSLRLFTWTIIALFLVVGAGLYWNSRGENKGQAAETMNVTVPGPAPSILVAHWTFDGSDVVWGDSGSEVKDVSGNNYHGNALGSLAAGSAVIGTSGQGLQFNGTSDYVDMGTSFDISTKPFRISAWVKPSDFSDYRTILSKRDTYASNDDRFSFYLAPSSGKPVIQSYVSEVGCVDCDSLVSNAWSFVVVVADVSSTTFYVYKNGSEEIEAYGAFTLGTDATASTRIGMNADGPDRYKGVLDNIRIYNTALTATQVADLYRSSGAKQTINFGMEGTLTDGLVGHWTMDGNDVIWGDSSSEVKDRSGIGNHGNAFNLTASSAVIGKLGQGLSFNGTSDYVDMGTSFDISAKPFTLSAWVYQTSKANYCQIFSKRDTWNLGDMRFSWTLGKVTDPGVFLSSPPTNLIFSYDMPLNTWTYLAVVVDTSTTALFVNGALNESLGSFTLATDATAAARIGSTPDDGEYFSGRIDDVRVYNRALSAAEVFTLYATSE